MSLRSLKLVLLVLCCVAFSALSSAQTFTTTNYAVGPNAVKLIRADVNHDGAIDLITANGDGTITILLNNGNGTFRRVDAIGGSALIDIFAGDINGDGNMDLVVVDRLSNGTSNLNLLLGRGDGTFDPPVTIDNKQGGAAAVIGDFNMDGHLDIAFGWNSSVPNQFGGFDFHANVTVYFGNGSGGFLSHRDMLSIGSQADYANGESGYQIRYMNVGDFNHDGKTDFAIAECCGGSDVELGSAAGYLSNGDGTFSEHFLNASVPNELRAGDIDGNGTTDLMIPYNGCHTPCNGVTTYRIVAASGQGLDLPDPFGSNGFADRFLSATLGAFDGPGTRIVAYTALGTFFNSTDPGDQGILSFATVSGSGFTLLNTINTGSNVYRWLTSGDFNSDGFDDIAALVQPATLDTISQVVVLTNKGAAGVCPVSTNRTVKICNPAAGSTDTSPVQVIAGVRSDSGVTAAQIYLDGVKVYQAGAGTTLVNRSLSMTAGTHRITVKGWDASGSFSVSETITVSSTSGTCTAGADRTVNICAPTAGGTVTSPVHVQAALRSSAGITAAQIYLDGVKVYQAGSGTTTVDQFLLMSAGSHHITVKGWDSSGSFSASETFTVQ